MTNFTKPPRRCAVPSEPGGLRLGLLLYLLLVVVTMASEARADTCRLSVSQSRVDYGVIRQSERSDGALDLGTRTLHLSIVCADPSVMALRFNGAPAKGQGFRFGRQGQFTLNLKHAQVDGQVVEWAVALLPGEPVTARLSPGHTLVARVAGVPVAGRRLVAQVEVDARLPSAALGVRSETLLEGLGNFELVSLAVPPSR
ncbi:hypothetical protein [Pseudomonas sp. Bout1]|uniref:hypothetical protein n=1 Tax=Pseudomonas sp. Bout1 TaxID=3048600 RepID=UPI0039FD162E